MNETLSKPILRLLIIIAEWEKASKINALFESFPLRFCYLSKAEGTASSDVLEMLGLGHTDKALALCVAPQPIARAALAKAADTLRLKKKGAGIAFTVPLSAVAVNLTRILNGEAKEAPDNHIDRIESEVEKMKTESTMTLIMSIVNQGFSEDLMDAAKSAGATGGTTIHARRLGSSEQTNFLGLPFQAEKEIVFIIAERDAKVGIMKAINQKCGPKSEAHGIVVALPVDGTVGI
jgi:hypothetical protein